MEPAPSVAFMRQMLKSCEKRAGGGLAYHKGKRGTGNPPPRAETRQTFLIDWVADGAACVIAQALACCKYPLTRRARSDSRWRGGDGA